MRALLLVLACLAMVVTLTTTTAAPSCSSITDADVTRIADYYIGADNSIWQEQNHVAGLQREACVAGPYSYGPDHRVL